MHALPALALHSLRLLPLAGVLSLAGCLGGGGGSPTVVSGSVVKGPVSGANVCIYKATSSGKGDLLGCTSTAAGGGYSLSVDAGGDVIVEATGGSFTDEATGATKTLSDPMQVVLKTGGSTVTGVVTPLTTMAYSLAKSGSGGLSSASFTTAAGKVAATFNLGSVDITSTTPVVSGGAVDAYGKMLRAVSQYVANGGTLANLQAVSSPAALQSALQTAYTTINGSNITIDLAGLTAAAGGSTGGTGGPSGGTGSGKLTIGFATSFAGGISLPSVTVNSISAPAAGTFCSGLSSTDANLAGLAALGSVTINSCTGSGNSYTVSMTVSTAGVPGVPAITIPYTVTYTYS